MSYNTLAEENYTAVFRERIKYNIEEALAEKFSFQEIEHLSGVVIKVKLERAVFEYALLFRRFFEKKIGSNYKNYIIDLSDTLFLDSTFLGSIIVLQKRVNQKGGNLRVIINSEKTLMISQINNIGDILQTFSSVDKAVVDLQN
jgi:anti-anti-sigma factor